MILDRFFQELIAQKQLAHMALEFYDGFSPVQPYIRPLPDFNTPSITPSIPILEYTPTSTRYAIRYQQGEDKDPDGSEVFSRLTLMKLSPSFNPEKVILKSGETDLHWDGCDDRLSRICIPKGMISARLYLAYSSLRYKHRNFDSTKFLSTLRTRGEQDIFFERIRSFRKKLPNWPSEFYKKVRQENNIKKSLSFTMA
ncbi:hypothetical protein J4229_00450 [Candidatus Pacearchaeota archaeon]|nr:hypothetical protein [Candidatus Pacearchaeota archaeon]